MPRTTPHGSAARALADAINATDDDTTPDEADTWATAALERLGTVGDDGSRWDLVHVPADHWVDVSPADRTVATIPPGHDAVMVRMDFDAEIDTLAACVKLLDPSQHGQYLHDDERARIVAYLAERYIPGVDIAVEYHATTTEGA